MITVHEYHEIGRKIGREVLHPTQAPYMHDYNWAFYKFLRSLCLLDLIPKDDPAYYVGQELDHVSLIFEGMEQYFRVVRKSRRNTKAQRKRD